MKRSTRASAAARYDIRYTYWYYRMSYIVHGGYIQRSVCSCRPTGLRTVYRISYIVHRIRTQHSYTACVHRIRTPHSYPGHAYPLPYSAYLSLLGPRAGPGPRVIPGADLRVGVRQALLWYIVWYTVHRVRSYHRAKEGRSACVRCYAGSLQPGSWLLALFPTFNR